MNYIYFFNHIPKCAGTTIRFALKEWFIVQMDYQQGYGKEAYSNFINNPLDLKLLKSNSLVSGHYCIGGSYLSERYPEVRELPASFRLITFVREPLAQMISLFNFRIREGQNSPEDSLVDYLFHQRNFISRILECNDSNYKEVIDRYYFVGTQEKLQESLNILARKLDKPPINLKKYSCNVAPKSQKTPSLSQEIIERFQANNSLDYKIFYYCNEILNIKV